MSAKSARTNVAREPRVRLGMALGLIGVAIFGASLPATKLALVDFSPAFVTFSRAAMAGVAGALILLVLRRRLPREALAPILWSALLLAFGFSGFMALGMQIVPASSGGVVLGIMPLGTAILAALFAGERPSTAFWVWGFIGGAIVVAFTLRNSGGGASLGYLWLLLATACSTTGYLFSAKLARVMPGWEVISWAMAAALPVSLVGSFLTWEPGYVDASSTSIVALLYAGFFAMFLGFFAWNAGLAMGGIARVSQVQLLQVFFTLAISAIFVGERIDAATIGFAVAVAAAVWMGRRAKIG